MTTPTGYTENEPVIVDAHDGPLRGMYLGTRTTRNAYAPNRTYLRIRVTETTQGYTEGEIIDALPVRVTRVEA